MKTLREILEELANQQLSVVDAEKLIKTEQISNLDPMAQLDFHRHVRTGIPEVIFAESKSVDMVLDVTHKMLEQNGFALLARLKPDQFTALEPLYGQKAEVAYEPNLPGRIAYIAKKTYSIRPRSGVVGIITAGTSDIPIAEEAKLVLKAMGISTLSAFDVGIAGFHRIFAPLKDMIAKPVDVIIVIAGMEGTLPGVVSALVDVPVIGVPTSSGYGLGANGIGALTTMLQSCSPGLAVVNIDNGFGAAAMAALIVKKIYEKIP